MFKNFHEWLQEVYWGRSGSVHQLLACVNLTLASWVVFILTWTFFVKSSGFIRTSLSVIGLILGVYVMYWMFAVAHERCHEWGVAIQGLGGDFLYEFDKLGLPDAAFLPDQYKFSKLSKQGQITMSLAPAIQLLAVPVLLLSLILSGASGGILILASILSTFQIIGGMGKDIPQAKNFWEEPFRIGGDSHRIAEGH
jgi:hypothetical protein